LLCEAFQVYGDEKYLKAALLSGEKVWKEGLLKKGFGLCHGTCGNAYFLHSLFRATKDKKWRDRALMFLWSQMDADIKDQVGKYPHSGFAV